MIPCWFCRRSVAFYKFDSRYKSSTSGRHLEDIALLLEPIPPHLKKKIDNSKFIHLETYCILSRAIHSSSKPVTKPYQEGYLGPWQPLFLYNHRSTDKRFPKVGRSRGVFDVCARSMWKVKINSRRRREPHENLVGSYSRARNMGLFTRYMLWLLYRCPKGTKNLSDFINFALYTFFCMPSLRSIASTTLSGISDKETGEVSGRLR